MLAKEFPEFAAKSLFGAWFGTPHLVLISKDQRADELKRLDWESILEPPLLYAGFHQTNQVGKSVFGEGPVVPLNRPPEATLPILAFRQIARTLLERARAEGVAALLEGEPDLIVDLYCGTGELAPLLPEDVAWLGIESSKEAVAYANQIRPGGSPYHEAFLGLMEDRLRDRRIRDRFHGKYAIYINPPRPGLGETTRPTSSRPHF